MSNTDTITKCSRLSFEGKKGKTNVILQCKDKEFLLILNQVQAIAGTYMVPLQKDTIFLAKQTSNELQRTLRQRELTDLQTQAERENKNAWFYTD